MTVSTIATIAANLSRLSPVQDAKSAVVLKNLVAAASAPSDTATAIVATDNTADVSLQSQIAQFRVVSQSIAAGNTALAAAAEGASAISRELGALHDLAQQAANVPLSDRERAQIDAEFQAIRSRINAIASQTRFNDEPLLDGSAQLRGTGGNAEVKSLTDEVLFQGANPNLLTVASSKQAETLTKEAQTYTDQQIAALDSLQKSVDYAASTVQTAIQNNDAAQSTLTDADFEAASASIALQPDINAQVAQTTRLPNNLLALLSE